MKIFLIKSGLSCDYHMIRFHDVFCCRRNIEQIRSEGVPKLEQLQNESDEEYFELTIILR